ncbi:MAG: hypothetical protein ACOWWM_15215 [Desulfobacterales bacterium]
MVKHKALSNNSPKYLPVDQIEFVRSSGLDQAGRVFRWKNEIYRGISASHAALYIRLFGGRLKDELEKFGLVPTDISEISTEEYNLVLRHETIPYVSYPIEWCSAMLMDAAILICNLQKRLLTENLVLKDGHPFNILFKGTKPYFVDIGSIDHFSSRKFRSFFREFTFDFFFPLLLFQAGHQELIDGSFLKFLGLPEPATRLRFLFPRLLLGRISLADWISHLSYLIKVKPCIDQSPITAIRRLQHQLLKIKLRSKDPGQTHSHSNNINSHSSQDIYGNRTEIILAFVDMVSPDSIIVFSDCDVHLTEALSSHCNHIVDANRNDDYLNRLYDRNRNNRDQTLLPLRINFSNPTPPHGPWRLCADSMDRLRSDLGVFLCFKPFANRWLPHTLDDILDQSSRFAAKWAIFDFQFSDSTFMKELHHRLKHRFRSIEVSVLKEGQRIICLCGK